MFTENKKLQSNNFTNRQNKQTEDISVYHHGIHKLTKFLNDMCKKLQPLAS